MSNVKNDIKLALRNLSYILKSDCCDYFNKTKGQVVCDVFTWAGGYPLVSTNADLKFVGTVGTGGPVKFFLAV